ncbi:helix-turn-helix transcriptional regulator [Pseudonocardia hydrocarbonoxydans]|uniref:Helix-turn-helix domain-containing protein n=1 Tax=Pseudonocardia hydrocarbonoxydans TaxID=76726 RepID=A0A4Y3WPK9_9PSEU|nr:helix-turn-helix domain-containing protein [Pseudonocardia hydrocarbonoxydans]GEC20817.1 hypothetical protein PHY01_31000 [Pseudonocardia hydrocarbonoxydans]
MERKILGSAEVAEYLGVPVETLKHWRYRRQGPAFFRLGRKVAYDLSALDAWLDEQRQAAQRAAGDGSAA